MKSNKYVLKALDAYPYNLEEASESLEYALSYDSEDTTALCLMGRMHGEIFKDFEAAKNYFLEALAVNVHAIEIYPHYINVLIWNEDYADTEKFIDFAMGVKGTDKSWLLYRKAELYEQLKKWKPALKMIKEARVIANNTPIIDWLKTMEERIKTKSSGKKKSTSGKKNKKKRRDKKNEKAA
ncbi:MAG: hypothetical protein EOP54_07075 [Sphingobacteriales bacterium]|nr:MAG: hypothetical protein EOP54_07075 [Sphingobacteriales bacterium]